MKYLLTLLLMVCKLSAMSISSNIPHMPAFVKNMGLKGIVYSYSPNAKATVVEFFAYECPSCLHFHRNDFPVLKREFIDTNLVNWVAIPFPLGGISMQTLAILEKLPLSKRASFSNELIHKVEGWPEASFQKKLKNLAYKHGLNPPEVEQALTESNLVKQAQYMQKLQKSPITGTPTFYINKVEQPSIITEQAIFRALSR